MKKIQTSYKILAYFFNLINTGFSDNRFYSETFLFKIKNIKGMFFLLLKILCFLTSKNNFTKHFIIFLKNIAKEKTLSTKTCLFVLSYLINISSNTPGMSVESNHILLLMFRYNIKRVSIVNFLFISIVRKFLFEINYKKCKLCSIIFILYSVFWTGSKSKCVFFAQYVRVLQSIITKVFFTITDYLKINYLHKAHLKYIKYLIKLFKHINYHYLFYEEKSLYNWTIVFFFTLNTYSNDFNFKKKIVKLKLFILNVLYKICYHYQDKFFVYLPILCKLVLKFPYKEKIQKFKNSIELLILVNSIDKSIVNSNNNFKKKIEIFLFQIISNHIEIDEKLKYCPLYIFPQQSSNFQKRVKCINDLIDSISFQKEDIKFSLKTSSDCSTHILYYLHISFFTFYIIFYLVNFSHIKGIRVTCYMIKRIKFLHQTFFEYFKNFQIEEKDSIYLDFLSLFIHQLSVRILSKNFFVYNFLSLSNNLIHRVFFVEHVLTIKGNNKREMLMWHNNMSYQKNLFLYILAKLKENEISFINNTCVKKLFVKIALRSLQKKKNHKSLFRLWILSILEFFVQKENQLEFQCDFEILNITINCLIKTDNLNFLHNLYKNLFYMSNDYINDFPYLLDIFSTLLLYNKFNSNVKLFVQLFRNLFNPHLWSLKFLIKSMLNYLKIFIGSKFYNTNKDEFRSICCIIQFVDWDNLEKNHFLFFLINFLNIIKKREDFLIHFIELFLGNEIYLFKKNKKVFFFLLITLYQIGLTKISLVFKKIYNKITSKMIRLFFYCDLFTYDIKIEQSLFFFLFFVNRILIRGPKNLIKILFRQNFHIIKILQNTHKFDQYIKCIRVKNFSKICTNIRSFKHIFILNKIMQYNIFLFFYYELS